MSTLPLEIVGHLEVPAEALRHRFVLEGLRVLADVETKEEDSRDRVVGTNQTSGKVQLYGWAKDIPPHADDTGFIYGVCLNPGTTTLLALDTGHADERSPLSVTLSVGEVFRLDDRVSHWTQDSTGRLAVFAGPYREPCDAEAIERLRLAIGFLAEGRYQEAPRVSEGYVLMGDDECWATANFEDCQLMLKADAQAQGHNILECWTCGNPATVIDHYWPYEWEGNLCARCR